MELSKSARTTEGLLTTAPEDRQVIADAVRADAQYLVTTDVDDFAIEDLHAWLVQQGDWVPLGAADEKKEPAAGTVEEWGRSPDNPVGGWYGLRKGYRGVRCQIGRAS